MGVRLANGPDTLDIAQAIDGGAWSRFQKELIALAALAFAVDGLANQALGLAIPALVSAWGVPKEAFSQVAAAGLAGVILGTAVGGWIGDRLGRRRVLIGSVLLFGVATTVSPLCSGPVGLLVLRTVAGVGIGGAIPSGTALIAEFTPARRRSLAIALGMVFLPVGQLLSGVLAAWVLPHLGWQGLFALTGILPLMLAGVLMRRLPESPRFLARLPARSGELAEVMRRCGLRASAQVRFIEVDAHVPARHAALLGRGVRADTLALWAGFFFCQLGSYSMFSWVPTLLHSEGFTLATASLGISAFNVGAVAGGVGGGWLIGAFGSRRTVPLFAAGALLAAVVLGLIPEGAMPAALTALIVEGLFIAALATGLYTLAAHVYPPHARATGVGAAVAVGRIGAVLSSYSGIFTMELGGGKTYFLVIAAELAVTLFAALALRNHIPGAGRRRIVARPAQVVPR